MENGCGQTQKWAWFQKFRAFIIKNPLYRMLDPPLLAAFLSCFCAILSLGDEMLLHGMSLAFVGVSHKQKFTSLGSVTVFLHSLAQSRCGL